MAFVPLRAPNRVRPQLHRQPVDQPRQLPFARRLLDQAFLSCAEILGPIRLQRKGIESEFRIQGRGLVREQALEMLRLAAGDRGRNRTDGDAAVDPIADERQSPGAEVALFELADQRRNQALEGLARGFRMRRRLFQTKCGSLRARMSR